MFNYYIDDNGVAYAEYNGEKMTMLQADELKKKINNLPEEFVNYGDPNNA